MPYYYRKKRKTPRRTRKRKRRYRRSAGSYIARNPVSTLGNRRIQRFRYCDRISLDAGIAAVANYSFRANSLYDPDLTGTGHQPMLYDQLMTFYEHYTVLSSKIKVTWIASDDTGPLQHSGIVGIELSGSQTPTTDFNDVLEQGRSKWVVHGEHTSNRGIVTTTHSVNMSKFLSQNVLQEDANAGTETANPLEQVFFHLFSTGIDGTGNPTITYAIVELDFVAMLHEPKKLAGS